MTPWTLFCPLFSLPLDMQLSRGTLITLNRAFRGNKLGFKSGLVKHHSKSCPPAAVGASSTDFDGAQNEKETR